MAAAAAATATLIRIPVSPAAHTQRFPITPSPCALSSCGHSIAHGILESEQEEPCDDLEQVTHTKSTWMSKFRSKSVLVAEIGSLGEAEDTAEADEIGSLRATGSPRALRSRRLTTSTITLGEKHFPRLAAIVKSKKFEIAMGIVITVNCMTMGFEAELLLGHLQALEVTLQISEHLITFIFLIEFILRLLVYGWRYFAPRRGTVSNFLDALLMIVAGVMVVWILPVLGFGGSSLRTLTALRALRLARLVRVVQKFEAFHEVWLLLRGLMESGRVLIWTVVVICFITYMFAVFGVVLLSVQLKDAYEDAAASFQGVGADLEELVEVTSGILPLMYTLVQVLTLDSWNSIARPMMRYVPWAWAFFYLYIAIAVIVMMNLVTAVIVENALKNSQKDADALLKEKEKRKKIELARFQQVFEQLDADGDGELSWLEFESAFEDKQLSGQLRLLGIDPQNCAEIFHLLDSGDGVISVKDFFHGISCIDGPANAKELLRTNKTVDLLVKILCQQNQELREDLGELLRQTPGANLMTRKGSLKTRARKHQPSKSVFHTEVSCDGTDTVASTPDSVARTRIAALAEQPTLSDLMKKLEHVVGMVQETRQESQQSFDACTKGLEVCTRNVCSLSSDMTELRSNLLRGSAASTHKNTDSKTPKPVTPRLSSPHGHNDLVFAHKQLPATLGALPPVLTLMR